MEINFPGLGKVLNFLMEWEKRDRRKILPYEETVIGTYQTNDLSVDIRAKIILRESTQPNVEIFLDRIKIGRPYCPNCFRPLDYWNATWMADGIQMGYKCSVCRTEREGDRHKVLDDAKGEIRKNYSNFWSQYKHEIDSLTKGKPHKYKLKE